MILLREPITVTAAEYLVCERSAETKGEYYRGAVRPVPRADQRHNIVLGNILASLHIQLRKQPCEIYPSDMRFKVEATELITYPDISVVCGEPRFDDGYKDTLLNPTLLIEVLSPSTSAYDRGEKFENYRQLTSLQEYLLVAQEKMQVECYSRQPDNTWLFTEFKRASDHCVLASIGCTLAIEDVYEKVTLDPPPSQSRNGHFQ